MGLVAFRQKTVYRIDKDAGWNENIVVKVEYETKDGKLIKNNKENCSM